MNIYIIDTSSLIELKDHYPRDIFPGVWNKIEDLYRNKRLISPQKVKEEINRVDDDLKKWVNIKKKMFVKPDEIQIQKLIEIIKENPNFVDPAKTEDEADPFLIALARKEKECGKLPFDDYIIITQESKTKQNRIPTIANKYGINSMNLLELFKAENWSFR